MKRILLQSFILAALILPAWSYSPMQPYPASRLDARDAGIVLRYGDGPDRCDELGARDVVVWEFQGTYYMNYDGAGPKGWLVCAATSKDLVHWKKEGAVIGLGAPGSGDSATASYGVPYYDGRKWHLFYLGSDHVSPAPDLVPIGPYHTFKAEADSPLGPWRKRYDIKPFSAQSLESGPKTINSSPGMVVRQGDEYLMFYTGLGIARTKDLDGTWKMDPQPLVTPSQRCENASVYYEPANQTWFLFTNHIGEKNGVGYTDGVWVFWTKDVNHWSADDKAIVLDGKNCAWSRTIMGLPSVLQVGNRLAIFYDGREDPRDLWHMKRHIGLAWLDLPLRAPVPSPSPHP